MKDQDNFSNPTPMIKFWNKLPLIARAILVGFIVNTLGVGIWLLGASFIPAPWSILFMVVILFIYWQYFSGNWGPPNSTRLFRQSSFRKTSFNKPVRTWSVVAAFLLFVFLNAALVLTFRIVEFQPDTFKTARYLETVPTWLAWAFLIMASMVAGICEEIGFRGYMQAPMEKKYGPVVAITITSVVFVVVHLHQAWAGGLLIHIFVVSFMIGYLAYATNSLLPGILAHTAFDIVNFSYWWSDVAGNFERKPIGMTGVDAHFIITAIIVGTVTVLFVISIKKLLVLKKRQGSFDPHPNLPGNIG